MYQVACCPRNVAINSVRNILNTDARSNNEVLILRNMNANLKAVRNTEYKEIAIAAVYFEEIPYETTNEGCQLQYESEIEE